jgi:hypothetical protein
MIDYDKVPVRLSLDAVAHRTKAAVSVAAAEHNIDDVNSLRIAEVRLLEMLQPESPVARRLGVDDYVNIDAVVREISATLLGGEMSVTVGMRE